MVGTRYRCERNKYVRENMFIRGEQIKSSIKIWSLRGEFSMYLQRVGISSYAEHATGPRSPRKAELYITSHESTATEIIYHDDDPRFS